MLDDNMIQFEYPANFTIFDKKKSTNKNINIIEKKQLLLYY
jgi:hypothetical protein